MLSPTLNNWKIRKIFFNTRTRKTFYDVSQITLMFHNKLNSVHQTYSCHKTSEIISFELGFVEMLNIQRY